MDNQTRATNVSPSIATVDPAGQPVSPPNPRRDRVRRHMNSLLGKAAAAGIALQATGCPSVCDPLPPPQTVDCGSDLTDEFLSAYIFPYARWASTGGATVVLVDVNLYQVTNLKITGAPTVEGGTLSGSTVTDSFLTFTITPDAGVTSVAVSIPVSCDEKTAAFDLVLDVSGTPEPDARVPITLANK
ncbi:MAG: hypothetical protein HY718_00615 [Planctomycetes bacterium]|nr:hypothetical protein [Planctomycetota bacterium]